MTEGNTAGEARAGLLCGLFVLAAGVAVFGLRHHIFDYVVTQAATPISAPAPPRLESAIAARPPAAWDKTFGDTAVERANAVAQLPGGELVFAGGAYSPENGFSRGTFFLLERNGALTHNRLLPGAGDNEVLAVAADAEGGVYLAGLSNYALSLTKTSALGDVAWQRTFDGEGQGVAHDVVLTPQGDILLGGTVGVDPEGRLWRLTSTGRTLWSANLGPGHVFGLQATPGGGALIAGTDGTQGYLARLDPTGALMWRNDRLGLDAVVALVVLPTGDVLGVGSVDRKDANDASVLVRLSAEGEILWQRAALPDQTGVTINAMGLRADGGVLMAGHVTHGQTDFNADMLLLTMDPAGTLLDTKQFGGPEFETLQDVVMTADNGAVLAGYTFSKGNGASDVWFASLGPNDQLSEGLSFERPASVVAESETVADLPASQNVSPPPDIEPEEPALPVARPAASSFVCQVFCETGDRPVVPYPVDIELNESFANIGEVIEAVRTESADVCRNSGGRKDRRQTNPVCRAR